MIAGTIVLEDHSLSFIVNESETLVTAHDIMEAGPQVSCSMSFEELGAILALAVGSDEIPGSAQLYPVAEAACARLGIRLIP